MHVHLTQFDVSFAFFALLGTTAAIFDVFHILRLVSPERHTEAKSLLERIASMLIKLAKSLQAPE